MAFVGVKIQFFIAETFSLVEQACGAKIKKSFDYFIITGQKLLPDFFERRLCDIADNYSTAGAAEDISKGVDVNTLCAEKGLFAV